MNIRRATEADEAVLRELWEEFEAEVPEPFGEPEPWKDEWADTRRDIAAGTVLIAEDDEGAVGVARAEAPRRGSVHVQLVHVRPRGRRHGGAKALLAEIAKEARERGASRLTLEVLTSNAPARAVWQRLGFQEVSLFLAAGLGALAARLGEAGGAATFGSIHVQTDDRDRVERETAKYRPRLAGPGAWRVDGPRNGWVSVHDELLERDPKLLQRLAKELSNAVGSVVVGFSVEEEAAVGYSIYDRGSSVDDYLSVPELHGPLPPGDVVSLEANPRVVQRLTGADPAAVRSVARTAASPAELPPARELVAQIAALMGIDGADRGYAG
ncbi:MAG TPA: GNAT family N-acetyltransferase [Gaiellaceae bacterium]|nr:GNAT family N-acetyltransferase [Gaiellaceae bacterium]